MTSNWLKLGPSYSYRSVQPPPAPQASSRTCCVLGTVVGIWGVRTVGSQTRRDTSVPCKGYRCYSEKLICVRKHSVVEINHPGGQGKKDFNPRLGIILHGCPVLLQACEQVGHHCRAEQLHKAAQGTVAGKVRRRER